MSLRVLCLFLCFWSCYHVQSIAGLTNQGTSVSDELLRLKQTSLSTKTTSKNSATCTSLDGPYCANFNGLEKPSFGRNELSLFDFKLKDTVKVFDDLTLQLKQLMKALTVGLPVMNFDSFDSSELKTDTMLPEDYNTGAPESVSFSWTGAWTVIRTPSDEPEGEGEAADEEEGTSGEEEKKQVDAILSSHTPQAPYITLVGDQARIKFSSGLSLDRFYVKKLKTKNKVVIQGLHKSWPRWTRTLGKEEMDWLPVTDGRGDLIDEIQIHAEPYALSMDNLQFRSEEQLAKVSTAEKKPKIEKIFMFKQKEDGFVMETIDGADGPNPMLEETLDKLRHMYKRQPQQTQPQAQQSNNAGSDTKRSTSHGQYETAPNAVSDEEDDNIVAQEEPDDSTVTSSATKQPEKIQVKLTRETVESSQKAAHTASAAANEDTQDPSVDSDLDSHLESDLESDQEDYFVEEEEDEEEYGDYAEEDMFSPEVVEREIRGINERLQRDFGDRVRVKSFYATDPATGEPDESAKMMREMLQQLFSQGGGGGGGMQAAFVQFGNQEAEEDEDDEDEAEQYGYEEDGSYEAGLDDTDSPSDSDDLNTLRQQQEEIVIEL